MTLWKIDFRGIWPVGAVAIVVQDDNPDAEGACDLFRRRWARHCPSHDPEPVTAELLDALPGSCYILRDGDY